MPPRRKDRALLVCISHTCQMLPLCKGRAMLACNTMGTMELLYKDRAMLVFSSTCPLLLLGKDRVLLVSISIAYRMLLMDKDRLVCNSKTC